MNSRWIFVFAFFLITFCYGQSKKNTSKQVQCGDFETPKDNPHDCVSDCCPIGDNALCPNPCPSGPCRCSLMSRRALNGSCISTRDCPPYPCGVNEVYEACPVCSEMCSNASPDGRRCRSRFHIGIILICKPKCRCINNHWRDDNNFCVPYWQCHPMKCVRRNEILDCVYTCPPEKTCRNRDIKFNCLHNIEPCRPKCVCKQGFYRDSIGECVPEEICAKCPGKNEFFSCWSDCDNVCSTLHEQNQTNCPIVNIQCNKKCYCDEGFARDEDGVCIPIENCPTQPKVCADNEVYTHCKKSCPPETCLSIIAKFKCHPYEECTPGCVCKPNYLRKSANASCTPVRECPELRNSPDFN